MVNCKTRSVLILLVISLLIACKHQSGKHSDRPDIMKAVVAFTDTLHDFGTFHFTGERQKHDFIFTNKGDVPAVILDITPSCHCTSVEYSKEPVMSGQKGRVSVFFDGKDQAEGHFYKSVRLKFNSEHIHNLKIKGLMVKG